METSVERCVAGADLSARVDLILVNAPLRDYALRPRVNDFTLPVLGMGYIATYASAAGFNVGVVDAEALGLGVVETQQIINGVMPRWVGFNLLAPTYEISATIAAGLAPEIEVMVGGHQAKAMPNEVIRDPRFARLGVLVLGEGETRVVELLRDRRRRLELPGVMWMDRVLGVSVTGPSGPDAKRHLAPDIDALPFVDRVFLADDPYRAGDGRLEANMVGARGCPYNCSFCGAAVSANPDITIRTRAPENIIEEMEALAGHGVSAFRFVDDLFLGYERFIRRCMAAFNKARIGDRFMWDATGRINILHRLDDELLDVMAANGCREVALGIESGSDRLLGYMGKRITPEMTRRVVERLTERDIGVKGYFILGFPTETREELDATVRHVRELWEIADRQPGSFRASVFEFRPYPGTPEWQRLLATGRFEAKQLLEYTALDLTDGGLDEAMRGRDEFNFSVNLQFGEAELEYVRRQLVELSQEQYERNRCRDAA